MKAPIQHAIPFLQTDYFPVQNIIYLLLKSDYVEIFNSIYDVYCNVYLEELFSVCLDLSISLFLLTTITLAHWCTVIFLRLLTCV
jgi:hypothetical protein